MLETYELNVAYPSSVTSQPDALTEWKQSPTLDMGKICQLGGHMGVRVNTSKMDGDLGTRVCEQIWKMRVTRHTKARG